MTNSSLNAPISRRAFAQKSAAAASASAFLAACGGGGSGAVDAPGSVLGANNGLSSGGSAGVGSAAQTNATNVTNGSSGASTGVGGAVIPVGVPAVLIADAPLSQEQAARMLVQASFGPTRDSVAALKGRKPSDWLADQMAIAPAPDYVNAVQARFNLDAGGTYRPGNGGTNYSPSGLGNLFWSKAVSAPDQLRQRVVHALLQIMVVSQSDSNLYDHARAFAQYLDNLGKHAFGNFRALLEDVALSPVMGIYLSHIRNQKADPIKGRVPDENFAREVMQLFTIGLYQLNQDGSTKRDSNGKPIETYNNDDVVGLARVFTGWSWDMPDGTSANATFRWGGPERYETVGSARFDLKPMRVFPAFHELGTKVFLGVTIPANTNGVDSMRIALDTLFKHPNVGPFIGKQLIQRLVTSNPSAAYVQYVAQKFEDNGKGVRGDMAAVVTAVLQHPEARGEPTAQAGKLKEPILRTAHALRALSASSLTGRWMINDTSLSQTPLNAPSVFNFYRPGYVPPNTDIANRAMVAPEFQIANESSVANWTNYVYALIQWGVGWTGDELDIPAAQRKTQDVKVDFALSTAPLVQALATSSAFAVDQINLLLFAGRMSAGLRTRLLDAMQNQVSWNTTTRSRDRLQIAVFIALSSSEFMIER